MNSTTSLILGAGIGAGAFYFLTKNNDGVNLTLPPNKITSQNVTSLTGLGDRQRCCYAVNQGGGMYQIVCGACKAGGGLNGLGARQNCCRWINMGGYSSWVCGPGLCRDSGGGNKVIGPGGLLGASSSGANQLSLTTAPITTDGIGSFVKNNWYWIAIIAYLALKK